MGDEEHTVCHPGTYTHKRARVRARTQDESTATKKQMNNTLAKRTPKGELEA